MGPRSRTSSPKGSGWIQPFAAIDKFSKWVEARPITNIRSEQVVLFFIDIIHRFGIPNIIITDNGM
jgi:hypothetical protein